MGSKVSKGIAETYTNNDSSTTYSWTLKTGSWSYYLSPDRYWNWFRDECCVESPQFIVSGSADAKFRIGLKDPAGLPSIVSYAKFTTVLPPGGCSPKWEILIGDAPNCLPFRCQSRVSFSHVDGKTCKCFLVVEFDQEPPAHVTLTIRLTMFKPSSNPGPNKCDRRIVNGPIKRSGSFCPMTNVENGRNIWLANVARLLSTEPESGKISEESDYHFDVTLVVEDMHIFYAHRSVLACHSPVFSAMFRKSNNFKESRQRSVVIEDISADTMNYLLRYLYTGEVEEGDDGSYLSGLWKERKVPYRDLLAASEKYDVRGLKRICELNLASSLTPDNVCELLLLADTYSALLLKAECLRFVNGRGARIGKSDAFGKLARQSSALFREVCSKLW